MVKGKEVVNRKIEDKKSVLITGCSSGIGLCAALTLKKNGYHVIATVRKSEDVARLKSQGLADVLPLDLCSSDSICAAIDEISARCPAGLYALFNNGAYGQPGAVEDLTRETLRLQFETNVFGTHELTVKSIPLLLQCDNSRIIQNSSVLGFAAMPMRGAYISSKFALEGLTDTLRLELSETHVQVSIIQPGPIATNFRKNALSAMERHIDINNSRHKLRYQGALDRLKKTGPTSRFTLQSEAVVKKLLHALESKRPKTRYYVTFPTYLFAFLRHILPTRSLDKIMISAAKAEG